MATRLSNIFMYRLNCMKCGYVMWKPLLTHCRSAVIEIVYICWKAHFHSCANYKSHHFQLNVVENSITASVIYAFHMVLYFS